MKEYHKLLRTILETGEICSDRTGVGTKSIFGYQMRFDLSEGFPAVTTKKLAWKSVVAELLWFIEGSTDERRLAELTYRKPREELVDKTTIWTANADNQGKSLGYENNPLKKELGPVYGYQWRNFEENTDQLSILINQIVTNQDSRRLILSAWNPARLSEMSLPPCHMFSQFRVVNSRLSCQMYQRSADGFLGVPFNIASYALLTHLLARECGLQVGTLVHTIGDAHIYLNHMDQVNELLDRTPHKLPTLEINDKFDLMRGISRTGFAYDEVDNFSLKNYLYDSTLRAPMAI